MIVSFVGSAYNKNCLKFESELTDDRLQIFQNKAEGNRTAGPTFEPEELSPKSIVIPTNFGFV